MKTNKPCAEVIHSTLNGWSARCWPKHATPPFGSIVIAQQNHITHLGIVHQIETGSTDPSRTPFAYQKSEHELHQEQPQIFEFLQTTISCLQIGYESEGVIRHTPPPTPAAIHTFISPATDEAASTLFSGTTFLNQLFCQAHQNVDIDALLIALISNYRTHLALPHTLKALVSAYSAYTSGDYARVRRFCQQISLVTPPIAG